VEKTPEHLGRRGEIRDDPVTQRVYDIHPFGLSPCESVSNAADSQHLAGPTVEGDGRRLVDDEALAEHVDEGIDGAKVDRNS
jgi:hypothetical protein